MTSIGSYKLNEITKANPNFSAIRSIVETTFYTNTVTKVEDANHAYRLAENATGVVKTDLPIAHTTDLGLPHDAKVLVFNDGEIVGRTAASRHIIGWPGVDEAYFAKIVREAMYHMTRKETLNANVFVGLDKEFMMKAHLLVPKGYETNVLSYMMNFQPITPEYEEMYQDSVPYDMGDIFIVADPEWTHPDFPHGVALFDPLHNTAVVLGLRYFGELKKGTLTLAWAAAHRNGFIASHGGMKQYKLNDGSTYTMACYGLSGSGKSTITLAKNAAKYDVTVLHDDAFVISKADGSTTALEPAYFDKTQDYPSDHETIKYFLTCMNVGVTYDTDGRKVLVNEDIRNGNGRTMKSRYVTPNRVDHLKEAVDAIYWIMKDDSLPPIVKIEDPILASLFGLTLATKRSTAENVVGKVDMNALVIEPFANPFRAYPLSEDFLNFKELFAAGKTDCYILNTGHFNGLKVKPEHTLGSIEAVVDNEAQWKDFGSIKGMKYLPIDGFEPNFNDASYVEKLKARMQNRLEFIEAKKTEMGGFHALPSDTQDKILLVIEQLNEFVSV
ncbi:MAG: phosphoenolpyruvate carboxykinase (ATP) [Streptococcaceae bacterium]|jgi:phosphoenolpyruvate carboxykinase (ATP)|nr:phosphoenolpyruvate carboxykinase (ATP) [Streptococcaceae bacterium]